MKLPQKAKELLESMARTIESLTAQLRRRGVVFDEDDWILKRDMTTTLITLADTDLDGVPDGPDNCQLAANPDQADTDLDLTGNACDGDDDNDLLADHADCAPLDAGQHCTFQASLFPILCKQLAPLGFQRRLHALAADERVPVDVVVKVAGKE